MGKIICKLNTHVTAQFGAQLWFTIAPSGKQPAPISSSRSSQMEKLLFAKRLSIRCSSCVETDSTTTTIHK